MFLHLFLSQVQFWTPFVCDFMNYYYFIVRVFSLSLFAIIFCIVYLSRMMALQKNYVAETDGRNWFYDWATGVYVENLLMFK